MNKTAQSELHRVFLLERLPEPLTLASRHLQILDRYIGETKIRLRQIRDPYTNESTRILQKQFATGAQTKLAEIHLDVAECTLFEGFAGAEIRKNRYFHEFDLVQFSIDSFLGPLQGLTLARAEFEKREEAKNFVPPVFSVIELTYEPFFSGDKLAHKSFADVTSEIERLAAMPQGS